MWTEAGVSSWFFPRKAIPANIASGQLITCPLNGALCLVAPPVRNVVPCWKTRRTPVV